ncbi:MAG: hypothetical protein K6G11_08910, partial [Lachnospiraceae bacterium]|nr:hypothetical protein [Lachnospiraceae bacterium]
MSSKKKRPESVFDDKNSIKLIGYNFIFFAILAIIFVNALNLSGYTPNIIDPASAVSNVNGYGTGDNGYIYNPDDDCYIVLANMEKTSAFSLRMAFTVENDVEIKVNYLNEQGEVSDKEHTVVWKSGTDFVDIPVESKKDTGYVLHIPSDFNFATLYYGIKYDNESKRVGWYVGMLVLALIISAIIVYVKKLREIERKLIEFIVKTVKAMFSSKKRVIKTAIIIAATFVLGILISFILGKANVAKFSVKSAAMILCGLYIIDLFIFARNQFVEKFERVGTIIILLVGITIVVVEPPALGISLDDETHYKNVMFVSHIVDKRPSLSEHLLFENQVPVALEKLHYESLDQKNFTYTLNQIDKKKYRYDISDNVAYLYA